MADALPKSVSALLERARGGDGPEPGDRERVQASLAAAIAAGKPPTLGGDGNAPAGASTAGAGSAGAGATLKWGSVLLAAALAGGIWVLEPFKGADRDAERTQHSAQPASERDVLGSARASDEQQAEATTAAPPAPAPAAAARAESATDVEALANQPGVLLGEPTPAAATDATDATDEGHARARPAKPIAAGRRAQPKLSRASAGPAAAKSALEPTQQAEPEPGAPEPKVQPEAQPQTQPEAQPPAQPEPPKPDARRELSLIQRATRGLSRGELLDALSSLETHAREFPSGLLTQEREGLRVLVLCKLGRYAEGKRAQRRFLDSQPSSPLATRVRAACLEQQEPRP